MKEIVLMGCIISALGLSACTPKGDMPSFNILLSDSVSIFNTKNIPTGNPSILIFFSPDCEHCQNETTSILQKMDSLKNVQFYFITIDPMERLKMFDWYYKIKKYPNITTGQDYTYYIPGHFKDVAPPYTLVYDRYKRLKAVYKGTTAATKFIRLVNEL